MKSLLAAGFRLPQKSILLSTGPPRTKARLLESVRRLENLGFDLYATSGTAKFLKENGVKMTLLRWPSELKEPNSATYLTQRRIDLVINIPKSFETEEVMNDYQIRRRAVEFGIPIITNPELVMALVDALEKPVPLNL